jgi:integrase/recombinase XerC
MSFCVLGVGTINDSSLLEQFETYLSESALAPATVVNYMADLRAFFRWNEAARGVDGSPFCLDAQDIHSYCLYLQQDRSHAISTVNRRLQALRKFYDFAIAQGWTSTNPADAVPLLADAGPQRNQCRSASEVERVLTTMQSHRHEWPPRDWAIIQAMVGAGLKLGELIQLRVVDLHLDDSRPHLCICSSSDGHEQRRVVPLEATVCEALRAYVATRQVAPGVDRFFVNEDGHPLSTRSVQRLLHTCVAGLTAQDLRYIYARTAYDKCGDVREVARLLGHRHLATTIRYLHPNSD